MAVKCTHARARASIRTHTLSYMYTDVPKVSYVSSIVYEYNPEKLRNSVWNRFHKWLEDLLNLTVLIAVHNFLIFADERSCRILLRLICAPSNPCRENIVSTSFDRSFHNAPLGNLGNRRHHALPC